MGANKLKTSRFLMEANLISEEVLKAHNAKNGKINNFGFNRNHNFKLESNETTNQSDS